MNPPPPPKNPSSTEQQPREPKRRLTKRESAPAAAPSSSSSPSKGKSSPTRNLANRSPEHQRVSRGRQRRPEAGAVGASPPKVNAAEKAVVFRRASDKNGGGG